MQTRQIVHIISCNAEGEVGDVIVGGVLPPPGDTLWAQSRIIAKDGKLRDFVLNEPRGGVFRHVKPTTVNNAHWPGGYRLSDTWPLSAH